MFRSLVAPQLSLVIKKNKKGEETWWRAGAWSTITTLLLTAKLAEAALLEKLYHYCFTAAATEVFWALLAVRGLWLFAL